ncbi:MAG: prephenate dehydrogenase/arogenate dehydrogenase family protein [Promethearchaeota archaeon]
MLGKKILIIGGSGGLGKVFGKFFKKKGFEITLLARNEERLKKAADQLGVKYELDLKKSAEDADIVMVSIPIKSAPEMIKTVTPLMKENALIFDVTSLKNAVYKELSNACDKYPINCVSLHPMFGPGIKDMKNYVMILLRVGGTKQYNDKINDLIALFKEEGLNITETTPKTHDLRVALTLGVPHMLNILFLNLLKRSDESLSELTRYTGTTFLLQKVFAESIIQREMEMFGEIQMENQEFHEILDILEKLIIEYKKIIKNKDTEGFNDLFIQGFNYSKNDNHFKYSYNYFYDFMKILKKEKI